MACTDYSGGRAFFDAMEADAFRDAIFCAYQDPIGGTVLGLFVFGTISMSLYLKQESMLLPTILTLLVGTLVVSQMPSLALGVTTLVLLFVVGLGPIFAIRRAVGAGV